MKSKLSLFLVLSFTKPKSNKSENLNAKSEGTRIQPWLVPLIDVKWPILLSSEITEFLIDWWNEMKFQHKMLSLMRSNLWSKKDSWSMVSKAFVIRTEILHKSCFFKQFSSANSRRPNKAYLWWHDQKRNYLELQHIISLVV